MISAYNPGWTNPNIAQETIVNYRHILAAAKKSGIGRLLVVGGAGTLFCAPGCAYFGNRRVPNEIFNCVVSLGYVYLNILQNEKELDWVFFSPAGCLMKRESEQANSASAKTTLLSMQRQQPHFRSRLCSCNGR